MRTTSLLATLAIAPALAQQSASLTGTVTNSVTGAPIARAHVVFHGSKAIGTLTDAEGKFSISGLQPGNYGVTAERVGFFIEARRGQNITLQAGDNSYDVQMSPYGAISGRVLDADGEPMQLVTVQAEDTDGSGSSGVTDKRGQYRIGRLWPGKYRVRASLPRNDAPPEIRTDGSKEVRQRSTFFPGVPTSKGASRVSVTAGGEVSGIDIQLLTMPILKVSGKVVGVPAGTKGSIEVEKLEDTESCCQSADFNKPDGAFTIWGLEPGKYRLHAEAGSGNELLRSPQLKLELTTADIDHLELRLAPSLSITGQIEYEDEQARVASKEVPESMRMVFFGSSVRAEIDAADSFHLRGVFPDQYPVGVALGKTHVRSVRLGAVESDGRSVDLRNASGAVSLAVVVSAAHGEVSGTVSDDKGPVAGAVVELMQDNWISDQTTDSSGRYAFRNVPPGSYRIVAGDERVRELPQDSELIEPYKISLVALEVHAGDKITQDLKQILPDFLK
jgi:Carboxypeptidase regulatory-like domain